MYRSAQLSAACDEFCAWTRNELFSNDHRVATKLLDTAVDVHLIKLYRELNLHELLQSATSAKQLAASLEFSTSAYIAIESMLKRLSNRHDFISADNSKPESLFSAISQPEDITSSLIDITKQMSRLGDDYLASLEFLAFGEKHFVKSMRDDHEFMDRVLTGQEKAHDETWHRATNTDPLQDIHGIMGGKAVDLLFEGGSILEVGGGTGNGLRNNLETLQASGKVSSLDSYIFSDVSMPFILNTKRALDERFPKSLCQWQLLNINKDWLEQRVPENSVSMIYGVNAAHIAMHTVRFLKECIQTLKPGGTIVFSERLRRPNEEMAPREIVLNQSSYHRTAAIRHPEYRPAHAYLARKHWLKACELAGFSQYEVWAPESELADYFPEQYAAVVVAQK